MEKYKIVRTDEKEKTVTFATFYKGEQLNHQVSVIEFDTEEKLVAEMLRRADAHVDEMERNRRQEPMPAFVQKLIK